MVTGYRLARESDAADISKVFAEAHDDLYRRRGFPIPPTNPLPPPPIFGFLIKKTPNAFWVASDGGKVVGFSDSFVRGSFWYFAWLFVSPGYQGRDIGKDLLERTLASWKEVHITNRATTTFAFNPVSQFLYMKYGMYSREPVYFVEAPTDRFRKGRHHAGAPTYERLSRLKEIAPTVRLVEESVLGFPLDWHHEYFLETKARCYVFKSQREVAGYAYVHPNGRVGPLAVHSSRLMGPVLEMAVELAAAEGPERVWFWTPGSNVSAVELAIKHGMRFDPGVFMCTKPFARWTNYIFYSAAMM